jgi:hypothetical protein
MARRTNTLVIIGLGLLLLFMIGTIVYLSTKKLYDPILREVSNFEAPPKDLQLEKKAEEEHEALRTASSDYGKPLGSGIDSVVSDFFREVESSQPQGQEEYFEGQSQSLGAPMLFLQQFYPKTPYISKENVPCEEGCGATGVCDQGLCKLKDYDTTVFGIKF